MPRALPDTAAAALIRTLAGMFPVAWRLAAVVALLAAGSVAARAQVVRVTLRDSTTAAPVVGALVSAIDTAGQVRADGLSSAAGVVTLRVPFAGRWAIGIRRIGVQPRTLPGVRVDAVGTATVLVALQNLRYQLPPVQVRATGVCGRRPEGADRVAVLWEQVTLALRSAVLSRGDSVSLPIMRIAEFRRELDTRLVEQKSTLLAEAMGTGRPFSAADADSLEQLGYVRVEADSTITYLAPDETVLLSDAFLRTHCFTAPNTAGEEVAELRFKPVKGRRLPDVEGTLYLDAASGALRSIDFRYVAKPDVIARDAKFAGGSVSLRRLPNGRWIVNHWVIRMPQYGRIPGTYKSGVIGYIERGGMVDAPDDDAPPPARPPARPPADSVRVTRAGDPAAATR